MIYSASYIWADYKFHNPYKYVISQGIFFIVSLVIMVIVSKIDYKLYKDKQTADSKLATLNNDIIKYELQTHEYFSDMPNVNKYFINSETELNKFYSIYSDTLD